MTEKKTISMAEQLYLSLPQVYRDRDNGDLKKYLNGFGYLLDRLYATLEQRLADSFPDNATDCGPPCQDWLLPYFADLMDVRPVSPHPAGQREEISNAVRWRQSKGTLACIESIAESVGQMEAEIQEGWQRVATTPRMGQQLVPARAFGYDNEPAMAIPPMAARHPALPSATVDMRSCSGAVPADRKTPGSKSTRFDGKETTWRQASPQGRPIHPGGFDDTSRRTPDLRPPGPGQGHCHPRRLLLHLPPPDGFFSPDAVRVQWQRRHGADSRFHRYIEEIPPKVEAPEPVRIFRNKSLDSPVFQPVRIWGRVETEETCTWRFEGIEFENSLIAHHAKLTLFSCALFRAESHLSGKNTPVILAEDCLIRSLGAARGRVDMIYCTLLEPGIAQILNISDTILLAPVEKDDTPAAGGPAAGCFRYSRYHPDQKTQGLGLFKCTTAHVEMFSRDFGVEKGRHCGVLHPACAEAVLSGAEDGGEMGAFHRRGLARQFRAVEEKLNRFIPVGMSPVVIPDAHLLDQP
ncbi:MAG: hypothetical protein HUN04_16530 [Desulfobacter sp.]|nr:MAG: hypothetical protein HUN04_16530 [Desulfobacter sp.]